MKVNLIFFLLLTAILNCSAQTEKIDLQKTWTYTYIKSKDGQKANLKEFLEKNWFAMDSIAVRQGLFNNYKLLENTKPVDSSSWDFIVAVEYFTTGTYEDIKEEWLGIRNNHQKVLIDGLDFPQLGQIVNSDEITEHVYNVPVVACKGRHIEMLKPFLGAWQEYLVTDEGEHFYGKLSIEINPKGCSLQKNFQLLNDPFTYSTLGYFDATQEAWIETYVFSNGKHAIYKWIEEEDDFLLVRMKNAATMTTLSRNRWTKPKDNEFQIIVEQSKDDGKTWKVVSVTKMKGIQ